MKNIILVTLIMTFIIGCKKEENPVTPPIEPPNRAIPTKNITGKLNLPAGSTIQISSLKIVGANEISINTDSSFQVETFDKFWCFLDVIDNNGKVIAMINDTMYNGIKIDEFSTSIGLVLSVPIPWELLTGKNRAQIISTIKQHYRYTQLVNQVKNVMKNDPTGLMDFERHPSILEILREIMNDLIETSSYQRQSLNNTMENGAYLDPSACGQISENIVIKNPKNIPFGISGFNLNGNSSERSSYFIDKKPIWIESKGLLGFLPDNWLPPITGEARREYKVGFGNYLICLSKTDIGWFLGTILTAFPVSTAVTFHVVRENIIQNYMLQGNYLEVARTDARIKAMVGTTFETMLLVVGIVPKYGDAAELIGALIVEAINSGDCYQMGVAVTQTAGNMSPKIFFEGILKYAKDNESVRKFLAKSILGDARKTKIVYNKIAKVLPLVTDLADGITKAWDLITSEQDIIYQVTKDGNNASNNRCIKSNPPNIPSVIVTPSNIIYGNPVQITMVTTDPEGKKIKYYLLKNGWYSYDQSELLNSGQSYTFTYNPSRTGKFVFIAQAQDQDGATSGQKEFEFYVKPSQAFFSEDFETYQVGRFTDNSIWAVGYNLPSEVRISNVAYSNSQSIRFIDYDPDIGEQSGYYAYVYTQLSGIPTSVEFALRIENQNDAMGVRTWNSLGYWSSLAYYITTMNGNLVWVKYGVNFNDPNDFVPIMSINYQQWYKIKLTIDWANKKYNIDVDGQRKYTGATFIGNVSSAPYFQAVAFIETQCRTGYLDKIEILGGSLSKFQTIISNKLEESFVRLTRGKEDY